MLPGGVSDLLSMRLGRTTGSETYYPLRPLLAILSRYRLVWVYTNIHCCLFHVI